MALSFAAFVDGDRYLVKRVGSVCLHFCKDTRSQDAAFSTQCEQGPPSLGLVNRKWGEAASHKSQAGNDFVVFRWAPSSRLTVTGVADQPPFPGSHFTSHQVESLSGLGLHALSSPFPSPGSHEPPRL